MSAKLYRLLAIARVDRVLQTANAPVGCQPQHRADRRSRSAPDTVDGARAAVADAEQIRQREASALG
ncbi:hypothetical protein ACQP2P_25825 [Dactylosporangium sp. CA-139114]|uniref:hypothetical protein n=1 Tax=Dactylosporangium sp. CA-139114 TaxID=3239931 RepID=UPI003D96BE7F